jgi:hypothetical protein
MQPQQRQSLPEAWRAAEDSTKGTGGCGVVATLARRGLAEAAAMADVRLVTVGIVHSPC